MIRKQNPNRTILSERTTKHFALGGSLEPRDQSVLRFGKHKGKRIYDVDDLPWLEWALKTVVFSKEATRILEGQIALLTKRLLKKRLTK